MSDVCMYQLEDLVWNDFCQYDDHIVPHPSDEQANEHSFHGSSHKKTRQEVSCVASDAAEPISQEKAEQETLSPYDSRNKALEKEGWCQKSDGAFPSSCNGKSIKEVSSLASGGTRTSNHCFKSNTERVGSEHCADDSILNDKSAVVGSSVGYPLDHMSEADSDLSFFGNNHEDKDSNDLLYYSWSDIGNFEDVDQMFRSCDSTFGFGARNEDDSGWFPFSDAIGGSEDALMSDLKFSCPESSALKSVAENHDGSIKKCNMQSSSVIYKGSSWSSVNDESASLGQLSFSNGSNGSDSKDELMAEGQIDEQKEQQLKHENQSARSRDDQYLANGALLFVDNMPESVQQQKQASDFDTYRYLRSDTPYMSSDYSHPSDHTSIHSNLSAVKSENSSLTSFSPKDSYTSNQVQSKEGSHDPSFQGTSIASIKGEKPHQQQGFQPSFNNNPKNVDLAVQASISGTTSMENLAYFSGDKSKNHTDVGGVNMGIQGEVGSSVEQGDSSMDSALDDISEEATSFHQLQLVMERLDLKTKLCIRDSLYRLAQSAEQRHNYVKLNGGSGNDKDTSGVLLAEGTNKYTGFMDMETETNPIDRSMAHLLYHRPADPSVMPGHDSLSLNSPMPASF